MNEPNSGVPPFWLLVLAFLALMGKQMFGVESRLLYLYLAIAFFTVATRSFFK